MAKAKTKLKIKALPKCLYAGGVYIKEFDCIPQVDQIALATEERAKHLAENGYVEIVGE